MAEKSEEQLALFSQARDGGEGPVEVEVEAKPPPPKFDGDTYEAEPDEARLSRLLDRVRDIMLDGHWRTLAELRELVGTGSEASISARLRDLRKTKHGAYLVERQRRGAAEAGLFEYRVLAGPSGGAQ